MIRIPFPEDASHDAVDDAAFVAGLALLNILRRTDMFSSQRVYVTPDHLALVHLIDEGPGTSAWVVRAEGDGELAMGVEQRWAGVLRAAVEGAVA